MSGDALRLLMTGDAVGGVWQYVLELARALHPLGVTTTLALLGPEPDLAQRKTAASVPGLKLIETRLPLDWTVSDPAELRRSGEAIATLASAHDLVQVNAPALAAQARFPVPVVAMAHSCVATWFEAVKGTKPDSIYAMQAEATGRGLRRADTAVAPSAAFAEALRRVYGLDAAPEPVHNGRTPYALPQVAPHDFALAVGRLWDEGKNVRTLDEAAERLAVPLYAAGPLSGPNGACVTLEHARALGSLTEPDLARWLAARPVFASAALYEPFGLAVLEAAAAGCPLVLSDIPTFRELWDGAATFVAPRDAVGFAEAIGRIAGDDCARRDLGDAARERAARYTPGAMATRMAALYRRLAGRAARAAA
jgi:glycosyltransferase involved in cell wall biosynthesis